MTTNQLAAILVRHGIIQEAAWEDPENYDGGTTAHAIAEAAHEIPTLSPEAREALRDVLKWLRHQSIQRYGDAFPEPKAYAELRRLAEGEAK